MIKKVLKYNQNSFFIASAIVALFIGATLILSSIQLKLDIDYAIEHTDDPFDSHYLVLNKHVSDFNTIKGTKNYFSDEEIEEIGDLEHVKKIAPFKSGSGFEVMAIMSMEGGDFPPFSTLAFFESIPNDFIDVNQSDWKWKEGEENVPIILPNTFLDAYNFGIAQTMNAPQVSKNIITSFKFKLKIKGNNSQSTYYANIVGFSDRVNSILVPENYLDFLNNKFGDIKTNSTRVIIATSNPKDPKLLTYLEDNDYETNKELTKGSLVEKSVGIIFPVLLTLGAFVVVLSFLIFILYVFLIIDKNTTKINWLFLLGFDHKTIIKHIFKPLLVIYMITISVATITMMIVQKVVFTPLIKEIDMPVFSGISFITIAVAIILIGLWVVSTFMIVKKRVNKIS